MAKPYPSMPPADFETATPRKSGLGKVGIAFGAITVGVLAAVACQPTHTAPHPGPLPSDPCASASRLPAYRVVFEDGSVVKYPTGAVQVREASVKGANGPALTAACRKILNQFAVDHRR
jgi:hypothetical protein